MSPLLCLHILRSDLPGLLQRYDRSRKASEGRNMGLLPGSWEADPYSFFTFQTVAGGKTPLNSLSTYQSAQVQSTESNSSYLFQSL